MQLAALQAKSAPEFPLLALAYFLAQTTGRDREAMPEILRGLEACEELGQLILIVDKGDPVLLHPEEPKLVGLVAWLRAERFHLESHFSQGQVNHVLELGIEELTRGPVVFVLEILAVYSRLAYRLIRELGKMRGVTHVAGWRHRNGRARLAVTPARKVG